MSSTNNSEVSNVREALDCLFNKFQTLVAKDIKQTAITGQYEEPLSVNNALDALNKNLIEVERKINNVAESTTNIVAQLEITFAPSFEGNTFTATAEGFIYNGIIPANRIVTVPVTMLNTIYIIASGGMTVPVVVKNFFGIYSTSFPAILSDFSWAEIAEISLSGLAPTHFQIGDEKMINLTTGESVTLRIEDFNHDNLISGGKGGITFGMKNLLANTYSMNFTNTTSGGYKASLMRSTHIPTILAKFPSDLRSVIKPVIKKGTVGGSVIIQTSEEFLWPFSLVEIGINTAEEGYKDEGETYPLYTDNASRIKRLLNGAGAVSNYWTRSPKAVGANTTITFMHIRTNGAIDNGNPSDTSGICLGFCI